MILGSTIICVIAPIVEEWFFRGIMLKGMLNRYSSKKSIILISILLGLMHLNLSQFIAATLGGIILSLIYIKYKSLGACILVHIVYNTIVIFNDWTLLSDAIWVYPVAIILTLGILYKVMKSSSKTQVYRENKDKEIAIDYQKIKSNND